MAGQAEQTVSKLEAEATSALSNAERQQLLKLLQKIFTPARG